MPLLRDDLAALVLRERCLAETTLALRGLSGPDAAAGNTRADRLLLGLPALLRGLPTRNEISGSSANRTCEDCECQPSMICGWVCGKTNNFGITFNNLESGRSLEK